MKHCTRPLCEVNPINDCEAPTSTGRINDAMRRGEVFGICIDLISRRAIFENGSSTKCTKAWLIKITWHITMYNINGLTATIPFDLIEGDSLLIAGRDVKIHKHE